MFGIDSGFNDCCINIETLQCHLQKIKTVIKDYLLAERKGKHVLSLRENQ